MNKLGTVSKETKGSAAPYLDPNETPRPTQFVE